MKPLVDYNLNVEYSAKEDNNFKKLAAGYIDLYPASKSVGKYLIQSLFDVEIASQFTFHPKVLSSQDYYLLISKDTPHAEELITKFDIGLRLLKDNGRYAEIMDMISSNQDW